ncbi:hypothetical protein DFH08DRAFT_826314 [Mycena albidolilacea]|uniref:Uncharacterized protein n=1 Tax=Mycena albidolilacea TaxID=1033008 RepID=A0AAD6Z083_9AGAR|nr:hypothetical protein DFH08DRAFT_826314 [Mycena albidolilacea]
MPGAGLAKTKVHELLSCGVASDRSGYSVPEYRGILSGGGGAVYGRGGAEQCSPVENSFALDIGRCAAQDGAAGIARGHMPFWLQRVQGVLAGFSEGKHYETARCCFVHAIRFDLELDIRESHVPKRNFGILYLDCLPGVRMLRRRCFIRDSDANCEWTALNNWCVSPRSNAFCEPAGILEKDRSWFDGLRKNAQIFDPAKTDANELGRRSPLEREAHQVTTARCVAQPRSDGAGRAVNLEVSESRLN